MKAAIIGGGPSQHLIKSADGFDEVFGCNDAPARHSFLTAVCCADTYDDIVLKRKGAFLAPSNIPFHVRHKSWERLRTHRAIIHKSKRLVIGLCETGILHSHHTPFFASSILIYMGATELYFYGVDMGGFNDHSARKNITDFNWLAGRAKLFFPESSEIWVRAKKLGIVLNAGVGA